MDEVFLDRQDREISLVDAETSLQAFFQEELVGALHVHSVSIDRGLGHSPITFYLEEIWVSDGFKCAGIGYELLASAHDLFYPLQIPENGPPAYLALLATAKRKGLLLKTWPKEHDVIAKLRRNRGRLDW